MRKINKEENINIKGIIIPIILTIIFAGIYYYIMLPAINVNAPSFWMFIILNLIFYTIVNLFNTIDGKGRIDLRFISKVTPITMSIIFIIVSVMIILNILVSPIFNASSYEKRITVNEDGNFEKDVEEVDFSKIPLLDKDSSMKLGDRVMGELPELVSQFEVSDMYTQINYNDEIIRVTPLEYSGMIKYFSNHKEGVKGYIKVNSVDGKSELIKLDKGMKYMPSAMFNENLYRRLRFSYPTEIFAKENFEIDNKGNPYWVIPTVKYTGVGMKREITGVITLDPITGESTKYDVKDVPKWIDHVYNADLIIEQTDNWGKYKKGFLNSIFGQKEVVQTTEGYNYLVMDDDVYLYTGITSVLADESNIGFILTNMRTKETNYYKVPGAEEYSAMSSAEGQVQQMKYKATFPLLIKLNKRATYLISLKDNGGLVKMYAFVDVKNYQNVVVTDAKEGIIKASQNYLANNKIEVDKDTLLEKEITIDYITTTNIEGTTYYYFEDKEGKRYRASIKVNNNLLPFLKKEDKVKVSYKLEQEVIEIIDINNK